MLKNVQEAKFQKVLVPISRHALASSDQPFVEFESFFTHILMHELMHGLGPQTIRVGERDTTVRAELKELNGTLEEAKADVSGLWALQQLIDRAVLSRDQERALYTTFLASTFRTLRFGLALQLNSFLDTGGVTVNETGVFAVNFDRIKQSVTSLTRDIMLLQANGDYVGTKALLDRMIVIRPEVRTILDRLSDVPVDIEPRFTTKLE
jgi:hypothetical protein